MLPKFEDVDLVLLDRLAREIAEAANVGEIPELLAFARKLHETEHYRRMVDSVAFSTLMFTRAIGLELATSVTTGATLRMGLLLGLRYHEEKERLHLEEITRG